MTAMSGCGGAPVASMMVMCVIASVSAAAAPAARTPASTRHAATSRFMIEVTAGETAESGLYRISCKRCIRRFK